MLFLRRQRRLLFSPLRDIKIVTSRVNFDYTLSEYAALRISPFETPNKINATKYFTHNFMKALKLSVLMGIII